MRRFCVAAAVLFLLFALTAGGAAASSGEPSARQIRTHYCSGTLHFYGSPYGFIARGVRCRFARHWSKEYQRHGKRPPHWTCVGRGPYTEGGSCSDRRSKASFEYYIED